MDLIATIKDSWGWVGIDPSRIVAENDFGNLIIEDRGGRYWRLCPEEVYCTRVANSEAEFDELERDPEFLADWEMASLTEAAGLALGSLPTGRKYCLKIPGTLGGSYEVENMATITLGELISFSGDIGYQTKDIPDGTKVALKVVD